MFKKAIIVAEIGCNHQGKIDKAKKLIRAAALCGANYVKFQKSNKYLLGKNYFKKRPNQIHSLFFYKKRYHF